MQVKRQSSPDSGGLRRLTAVDRLLSRHPLVTKIIIPCCMLYLLSKATTPSPARLIAWICLCYPILDWRFRLGDLIDELRASQWEARIIPQVQGRYFFNLDVMIAWLRHRDEDVGRLFVNYQRIYGNTFNTRVLGDNQILSVDPAVFDYVMSAGFEEFEKGAKFKSRVGGLLGNGIFDSDGKQWKTHRNVTKRFFSQDRISPSVMAPFVRRSLLTLPDRPFDIQAVLGELALELAVNWLTGDDLQTPVDRGSEWFEARASLGQALAEGQRIMGRRLMVGSAWDGLKGPAEVLRRFFDPLICKAKARQVEVEIDGRFNTATHLIDRLVTSTDGEREISDQLINVLLAARDTTASLFTFLTYAAIHEDNAFAVVEEEILKEIGEDGEVDAAALGRLYHCRLFIDETLRLFPPVPLNIRRAVKPTLLPGNMYIPGGTSIVMSTLHMHRSPAWWGDDADEFKPSRWHGMPQIPFAYKPFNAGARTCPGQKMALNAAQTYLVLLVQHMATHHCRFRLAREAQLQASRVPTWWRIAGDGRARGGREDMWPIADITLTVKGGLWVQKA